MPGVKRSKDGMKGGDYKRAKIVPYKQKVSIKKVVENYLKRKVELKELTAYTAAGTTNAAGVVIGAINLVSEGSDYNQRIGRHITSKQIQVDFYGGLGTSTTEKYMVALVYDSQPEAGGVAFGTIFDTTSSASSMAFKNTYLDSDRFKIVWIEQMTIGTNGPQNCHFRHFYAVPDRFQKCEFSGTTNQLQSGAWYVCIGSLTGTSTYNINVKYQFTDM